MACALPTPPPASSVAVLLADDAERARRLTERFTGLGARVAAPFGDEPADLVIADTDAAAAARRVRPGGTLVLLDGAAREHLESAPLVLAEIDVVLL